MNTHYNPISASRVRMASGVPDLERRVRKFASLPAGVRLEYVEQGSKDALPVVMLHGVTDSWRSFEPVLEHLPADIRAVALSQRGHGESDRPATGYSYRDMSEDLLAFLNAVGIDRAIVVGHSMGSMVAQRFVVDHPDRVAGVVLLGAFSTLYQDAGIREFVASAIDPLTDPIDLAFAREWQLSTIAQPIAPQFLEIVVRETVKVPSHVWRTAFHSFLSTPGFLHPAAVTSVPALLVWGDRDMYALREQQDALLAAISGMRFHVYEGAGHALHWEEPARFTADLVAFIRELEATPTA